MGISVDVATLSAVLYLALVTAQYVPHDYLPGLLLRVTPETDLPSLRFAQYTVFINLFGFLAVAWLSQSLSERLESAGARLEDASHQIEDLRAFNEYVIDSLLNKGVVLNADVILALADVDLVYLRLSALLCAADRVDPSANGQRHRRKRSKTARTVR